MFKDKDRKEILELFKGYNYQLINFNKNDIIALEYEPCNKIGLIISGTIDIKRMLASNNALHLSSLTMDVVVLSHGVCRSGNATLIECSQRLILKGDGIRHARSHVSILGMRYTLAQPTLPS